MAATMSFSNAPDEDLLGRVAGALAVDEAFIEKDWYVVQAIGSLTGLATNHLEPVFSGGTSLLKGYGLIRRFSEDIDFKLNLSEEFHDLSRNQRKTALRAFRDRVVTAWQELGFTITASVPRDEHRFLELEMDYPSRISKRGPVAAVPFLAPSAPFNAIIIKART